MTVSRRQLAAAGALAFGAAALLRNAGATAADSADKGAVEKAVDALRVAILKQDKAQLEQLAADQISYGHSDGRVQNKAEFIKGVMERKGTTKSIEFPELSVTVAGLNAIARHLYVAEGELDGKPTNVKIGALQVWQKQDGGWKLLARQGFKLA